MAGQDSFDDTLAALHAATSREADQRERAAGRMRADDYRHGMAVAHSLIPKITSAARSADECAANLRHTAGQQPSTLGGRVTAGELAQAAKQYDAESERQQPQRDAEAGLTALRARIARDHAERQGAISDRYYRMQRERER